MNAIHRARHAIRVYLARRRRLAEAERHAAMFDAWIGLGVELGKSARRLDAANVELKSLTGE